VLDAHHAGRWQQLARLRRGTQRAQQLLRVLLLLRRRLLHAVFLLLR
jgi:hypothetical protein